MVCPEAAGGVSASQSGRRGSGRAILHGSGGRQWSAAAVALSGGCAGRLHEGGGTRLRDGGPRREAGFERRQLLAPATRRFAGWTVQAILIDEPRRGCTTVGRQMEGWGRRRRCRFAARFVGAGRAAASCPSWPSQRLSRRNVFILTERL